MNKRMRKFIKDCRRKIRNTPGCQNQLINTQPGLKIANEDMEAYTNYRAIAPFDNLVFYLTRNNTILAVLKNKKSCQLLFPISVGDTYDPEDGIYLDWHYTYEGIKIPQSAIYRLTSQIAWPL